VLLILSSLSFLICIKDDIKFSSSSILTTVSFFLFSFSSVSMVMNYMFIETWPVRKKMYIYNELSYLCTISTLFYSYIHFLLHDITKKNIKVQLMKNQDSQSYPPYTTINKHTSKSHKAGRGRRVCVEYTYDPLAKLAKTGEVGGYALIFQYYLSRGLLIRSDCVILARHFRVKF